MSDALLLLLTIPGIVMLANRRRGFGQLEWAVFPILAAAAVWTRVVTSEPITQLAPSIVVMFLMPGFLILELAFPNLAGRLGTLERLPLFFSLSMFAWTLFSVAAYRVQLPSDAVVGGFLVADSIGLLALVGLRRRCLSPSLESERVDQPLALERSYHGALIVALSVFAITVGISSQYQRPDIDTYFHLAGYNKVADSAIVVGGNGILGPGYPASAMYASNPWYLAFGMTARLAHVDVVWLYVVMVSLLSGLSILSAYILVKALIRDPRIASVASILLIMHMVSEEMLNWHGGGIFAFLHASLPYPSSVTEFILTPILTVYLLRYVSLPTRANWGIAAVLAVAAMGQHPEFTFWIPFSVGFSVVISAIFQPFLRRRMEALAFVLTIGAIGVALIILTMSFPFTGAYREPVTNETLIGWVQNNRWWMPLEGVFARDPALLLSEIRNVLLPLGSLFLICYLGQRRSGPIGQLNPTVACVMRGPNHSITDPCAPSDGQGPFWSATAGMIMASWLIVFNPAIMPAFVSLTGSYEMVNRSGDAAAVLAQAVVYGLQAVVLFIPFLLVIKHRLIWGVAPLVAVLSISSVQLIMPPVPAALADAIGNHGWYPSMLDLRNDSLYSGLARLRPGVVAVRQEQAELVAALTPHYVIAVRWYWMGDYRIAEDHQVDNKSIVDFAAPPDEMRRLLDKYRCRYVVVPVGSPSLSLFRQSTTLFIEVVTSDTDVVFEVKR